MLRWFYVAMHLLMEASAARRDARIRFLKAEVEILRRKLGGNRVIPSPGDRAHLLAIGQELVALRRVGRVRCRRFLGGLLRHYYRAAA